MRAALEVFGESGYDAATFQEIAERADLTRPAINHYFPTKDVLYREVLGQTHRMVIATGFDEARRGAGFGDRVRAFVHAAVGAQEHDRSVAAFIVTSVLESQRHPELRHDGGEVLNSIRDFAGWVLSEGVADGDLRPDIDVDLNTEVMVAMLCGLAFYSGFVGDRQRLPDVTARLVDLLRCDAGISGTSGA